MVRNMRVLISSESQFLSLGGNERESYMARPMAGAMAPLRYVSLDRMSRYGIEDTK